jgi:hypothetical protein
MTLRQYDAVTGGSVGLNRIDVGDGVIQSREDVSHRQVPPDVTEAGGSDHADDLAPFRAGALLEKFDPAVLGGGVDVRPKPTPLAHLPIVDVQHLAYPFSYE